MDLFDAGDEPAQHGGCAGFFAFLKLVPAGHLIYRTFSLKEPSSLGKRARGLLQSKCPACTGICENQKCCAGEA